MKHGVSRGKMKTFPASPSSKFEKIRFRSKGHACEGVIDDPINAIDSAIVICLNFPECPTSTFAFFKARLWFAVFDFHNSAGSIRVLQVSAK